MSTVIPLRVAVRARPLIQKEKDEGCQVCLNFIPFEQQIILGKDRNFSFDFVFRPNDPQVQVYEDAVKPLIEHIFKGYNATVLAYGQTGSGKTFTMGGGYEDSLKMDPDGMGIIPRIVQEIFSQIGQRENCTYKVSVSYLEIINEELQDLLEKKDSLAIREENGAIKIPGLREQPVEHVQDIMGLLQHGCNNRTTAATAMNSTSSRSHAIFTVYIQQTNKEDSNDFWKVKLQLVDLAGSERIKKTHAEGERLKEGININKGLLSLGNVISVLGDENNTNKKVHVPYRDSKLTRILQDSLGGNSYTVMIACVSPADSNMEETLNTLRYADRARKIKNKPVVNWDPQTAEIMRLKATVQQLTMKLIHAGIGDIPDEELEKHKLQLQQSPGKTKELQENLKKWIDKCTKLEEEVESLSQELQSSVDQAASASERAIRWEMKCERLRERLKELEQNIGVDFELLSSSVVETNPVIIEQLERLKNFANKINDTLNTEEGLCTEEEEEDVDVVDGVVDPADTLFTPETKEFAKRHTLRRAQLNSELQELNKLLEKKEKIATQFSMNDTKMAEMLDHMKENAKQLEEKINDLETEKTQLTALLEDARTNTAASKVSEARRQQLKDLEGRMATLHKQLTDQKKLLKLKEQKEKDALKMNTEIQIPDILLKHIIPMFNCRKVWKQALKQARVKLMKQMKEDSDTWRKWKAQKDKEVLQLQQKDRKRQFEIQKLQRENVRTQSVLQRKSEEAAAANKRLKDAMALHKKVLEERSQKFDKCDNNTIGNRVKKWLSHELDMHVGIMEAKYHRESQLQDRKTLANQLRDLKETISDEGPPSKKLGWMDDSGKKHEASIEEESVKGKIHHLEQQIELRNAQISDLQQKIFDAEQESKGKSTKDNLHTMMEAKIAIKWLLDQAVSYKADNARLRAENTDLQENVKGDHDDQSEYIAQLERTIQQNKLKHSKQLMKMQEKHDEEVKLLLATKMEPKNGNVETLAKQEAEIQRLKARLQEMSGGSCTKCEKMEKQMTKFIYKEKSFSLMPKLEENEQAVDQTMDEMSPFLSPRPKAKNPLRYTRSQIGDGRLLQLAGVDTEGKCSSINASPAMETDGSGEDDDSDLDTDPDWQSGNTPGWLKPKTKRRRTDLFKQKSEESLSSSVEKSDTEGKICGCKFKCRTKRCACRKNNMFCTDGCKCVDCENMELQVPESTTTELSAGTTALNTTFEVDSSNPTEVNSSKEAGENAAKATTKPLKMTRTSSRPVLSQLQGTLNVSSSDEFEKPRLLRKSVSAGAMGSKTSKSDLRVETEEDPVGDMLDNITKKKRKLGNPQKGFFGEMKPE